jgi:predicted O-methyltransferase YrrM
MAGTGSAQNSPSHIDSVIDDLFSNADDKFLRSAITREEGLFLRTLASRDGVRATIEVGCGNGVSGLHICAGIANKPNARHTAIDPFQNRSFKGRGVANIRRAGIQFFNLIEQPSEVALPELLNKGEHYDMALIDGLHTADQTMLDFYFLDRMIPIGGIVAIDDVNSPAVNRIVRYVSTYPNYRLIGTGGKRGIRRRLINILKQSVSMALWPVGKALGEAAVREFFDISLVHPEGLWTIDFCTMAAFEKIDNYERGTDWYRGM